MGEEKTLLYKIIFFFRRHFESFFLFFLLCLVFFFFTPSRLQIWEFFYFFFTIDMNWYFFFFSFFFFLFFSFFLKQSNPLYILLGLVFLVILVISFFLFFKIELLSLLFLIIYVGAIAILFIFVIMLFNIKKLPDFFWPNFSFNFSVLLSWASQYLPFWLNFFFLFSFLNLISIVLQLIWLFISFFSILIRNFFRFLPYSSILFFIGLFFVLDYPAQSLEKEIDGFLYCYESPIHLFICDLIYIKGKLYWVWNIWFSFFLFYVLVKIVYKPIINIRVERFCFFLDKFVYTFKKFISFDCFNFFIVYWKVVDIFILNLFLLSFIFLGFTFIVLLYFINELKFLFFITLGVSGDCLDFIFFLEILNLREISFMPMFFNGVYNSVLFLFNEAYYISFFLFDDFFLFLFLITLVLLLSLIIAVSFSFLSKTLLC